jgi:hypothetical protein
LIAKVVDTNSLDSEELRQFLQASKNNVAVLCEWPFVEALNGDNPTKSLMKRFEILDAHLSQFLLVREAPQLAQLRGRQAGLSRRLLDPEGRRKLTELYEVLQRLGLNDPMAIRQVADSKKTAEKYLDDLLDTAGGFAKWYSAFASEYTAAELKVIRKDGMNGSIARKMTVAVRDLTGFLIADRRGSVKWPRPIELPNLFQYRLALMIQLHFFDWIAAGNPQNKNTHNYRNDMIDMLIGVTAPYFGGLISSDIKLQRLFGLAVWYLENYSKPLAELVENRRLAENK